MIDFEEIARDPETFRQQFEKDGFLVINNFLTSEQIKTIRDRASQFVEEQSHVDPVVFSSVNQKSLNNSIDYMLGSAGTIKVFWEEEALDAEGKLLRPASCAINKIAHGLHDKDEVFSQLSRDPRCKFISEQIHQTKNPLLVQSMYIFKQPEIGGEVMPHQDSTFIYTDPFTCKAFWIAMEDATLDNGCLWAIPGSHKLPVNSKYIFDGTCFKMTKNTEEPADWDLSKAQSLEVKAGTLITFDGSLVHFSHPNRSLKSREAYSLHIVDGTSEYVSTNWLQRSEDD
eukprot:CAMPEP_0184355112 /NCGR_PEP_ID=MMETSP1089-20130417/93500_1 /TAXON_ID=38269 ORGANISM="Gloeochaete wittrockiana, Strain SAG46.84" /NCGR_SAMPLE_ID=MMETSP1089 /ASSEMBLY_ACC=CAM_ASM_000445 /LENGTH=284 /DNA_ID=CAMNT_0026691559 /DNA_START=23 /DNA_END=874 /DNA_ORIENTATION=+